MKESLFGQIKLENKKQFEFDEKNNKLETSVDKTMIENEIIKQKAMKIFNNNNNAINEISDVDIKSKLNIKVLTDEEMIQEKEELGDNVPLDKLEDQQQLFKEKKEIVLNKDPKTIQYEDLDYIDSQDYVFTKLPFRYKDIISKRESLQNLYKTCGPELESMLKDPDIIEINLNQDGSIWIEKFAKGRFKTNLKLDPASGEMIVALIAANSGKVVTSDTPIISTVLPTGERFEGIIKSPVYNSPIFAIRKKPKKIFSLDDYVKNETISKEIKEKLIECINSKKNILVVGGTSSGKTTFCNSLLKELDNSSDRIVILEDIPELMSNATNKVQLMSTEKTDMRQLLRSCMRLTPDRIMIGELRRGEESMELLKLWNSGHSGGFSTIHGNGCEGGLNKLELYLSEVTQNVSSQIKNITEAIDVVIYMEKVNNYRKLKEIKKLVGYDEINKKYILEDILKK